MTPAGWTIVVIFLLWALLAAYLDYRAWHEAELRRILAKHEEAS